MFSKTFVALLATYVAAPVFAAPATPLEIALVKQQFINALITPAVVPTFNPSALLNASFPAVGAITTGQAISQADVSTEPTITIIGTDADFTSGGDLNQTAKYTLIMIDGDYTGATDANGVNTHYLQNDLTYGQATADVLTLTTTSDPIIAYAEPGPASGSGAHRYIILLFAQPANFTPPDAPSAGSSVTMIDFPGYVKQGGLGAPIAGNYFTVEVGTSTVSASPTTAVNTATLLEANTSPTGNADKTTTRSLLGPTPSPSASAKSAAFKTGVNGLAAGAVAMFFGVFLA